MSEPNPDTSGMSVLEPLVEPEWLEAHLGDPGLRVVDATVQVKLWPFPRVRSGRREFKRGHIPGAVFADLLALSDPNAPARTFTMPSAERFAEYMGRLGIEDGTRVVIHDGRQNMWAARLWWMLRTFGFDDAAVLNGGWTAWRLEGRPVSLEAERVPVGDVHTAHPAGAHRQQGGGLDSDRRRRDVHRECARAPATSR